jgi:hypothetical protein
MKTIWSLCCVLWKERFKIDDQHTHLKINKPNNYFSPQIITRLKRTWHMTLGIQVLVWDRHRIVKGLKQYAVYIIYITYNISLYHYLFIHVLQIVLCPFVLFLLAIVLSVLLRYADSDYHFRIFNSSYRLLCTHQVPAKFYYVMTNMYKQVMI